ncbi:MAG: hypothetical protein L0241_29690 [Planctomycetia bacterium]|nr:hypothetical protein [Planctomycetia bacterium]
MHSPAVALTWEFWGRHRLGLSAVGALVLTFAVGCAFAPLTANLAAINSMWFIIGLCYVIGVFAYGFDGRLESAESGFPARLFLLPVRTWVLVGWPMLQGVIVAVLLWLGWSYFVLRPSGIETPLWWSVMLAAVVAVSQAIVWLPFGLPWLRLLVAIPVLTALVRAPAFLALAGERFTLPETQNSVLSAFAAALIPLAFLVAWAGVSRARRGDNPDWLQAWRSVRLVARPQRDARPFSSAMWAQIWYEWRVRGFGFVVIVVFILAVLIALGALLERDPSKQTNFGVMLLLSPMLLAPFWSAFAGTAGVTDRSARLSAFAATRPLSNSALVVAKFRAMGLTAIAAGVIVLVVFPAWMVYTGGYRELGPVWDGVVAKYGTARAVGFCILFVVSVVVLPWRMLVVGMWAGLTGRAWVPVIYPLVVGILGLQLVHEWITWNADPARRERILDVLPWAAGCAVVLKFLVSWWALAALVLRGELGTNTIMKLLGAWILIAASLFIVLVWLIPSELVPLYGLALGVVLFVPLARLAVAPLALAWNRHR